MRRSAKMMALGAMLILAACGGERPDAATGDPAVTGSEASGRGTMVASSDGAAVPAGANGSIVRAAAPADTIEVWKDPGCGCCKNWIEHMEENGFAVVAHDTRDMTPVKQKHNVGADLMSCHTGTVRGYAIEGHVPADLIRRMLDEKPGIRGLAVPGMPIGSPGMEGGIKQKYDVIAFTADGKRTVYATR